MHALVRASSAMLTAVLVALAGTGLMLGYAQRKGMLDHPGQRRSHRQPTPRGGGVGFVAGALAGICLALRGMVHPVGLLGAGFAASLMVAGIGWLDDRHGLHAWPRLLIHLLAAGLFSLFLVRAAGWPFWIVAPLALAAAWSINLHNFMDGIDGLLGLQMVFIGLAGAMLGLLHGYTVVAAACLATSAAATGFLVFNLPPARIFMGDVGSGFAGLLVFMLGALWCADDPRVAWAWLALNAAFLTDAGATLAWRVLRGRRWYTAHREHLYQWLVRSGDSHGKVACLYLTYNLLVLAPLAWLALRAPGWAAWVATGSIAVTLLAWFQGRAHVLRRIRSGVGHA